MEMLIVGFASTELFGKELIEYFARETKTSISRVEKYKYEFRFPKGVPRKSMQFIWAHIDSIDSICLFSGSRSTRMFMQMLLEESKKNGFDIVNDG